MQIEFEYECRILCTTMANLEAKLSRKFYGVARMTSALDPLHTDEHWVEDIWHG